MSRCGTAAREGLGLGPPPHPGSKGPGWPEDLRERAGSQLSGPGEGSREAGTHLPPPVCSSEPPEPRTWASCSLSSQGSSRQPLATNLGQPRAWGSLPVVGARGAAGPRTPVSAAQQPRMGTWALSHQHPDGPSLTSNALIYREDRTTVQKQMSQGHPGLPGTPSWHGHHGKMHRQLSYSLSPLCHSPLFTLTHMRAHVYTMCVQSAGQDCFASLKPGPGPEAGFHSPSLPSSQTHWIAEV